jgi:thioredoxin reductase (NADPH)
MVDRAKQNEKIKYLLDSEVVDITGTQDSHIKSLKVRNVKTGAISDVPTQGFFLAIGHKPNTDLFKGSLNMDENGYLVTEAKSTKTNIPGVFACGDVQDSYYRQAVTAAGSGCMAAIDAERFLAH